MIQSQLFSGRSCRLAVDHNTGVSMGNTRMLDLEPRTESKALLRVDREAFFQLLSERIISYDD